jgi:chorismate mutase/prephenate dehydratase
VKIEDCDREIVKLINKRAELLKSEHEHNGGNVFSPNELSDIHKGLNSINSGPVPNKVINRIYTEIYSAATALSIPLNIAFLGPDGTFSHAALRECFGNSVMELPQKTIGDVFLEVERGGAAYGVVPVENSTEGAVTFTLDELIDTGLSIIMEKYIRISYCLLSAHSDEREIKKIYTHPQPLGQCKNWIRQNYPAAEVITVDSTSRAAELASQVPGTAAVASEQAASIFGLIILGSYIEDMRQNYTRFFVIGHGETPLTGNDKTSIICAVKDRPGALLDLLTPFAELGINMTKIESRPDKKKIWEYIFFIDFQGHIGDSSIAKAVDAMKGATNFLKILGSYPAGNI